jgi:hypothetical protein
LRDLARELQNRHKDAKFEELTTMDCPRLQAYLVDRKAQVCASLERHQCDEQQLGTEAGRSIDKPTAGQWLRWHRQHRGAGSSEEAHGIPVNRTSACERILREKITRNGTQITFACHWSMEITMIERSLFQSKRVAARRANSKGMRKDDRGFAGTRDWIISYGAAGPAKARHLCNT